MTLPPSGTSVNLNVLREHARQQLADALDQIRGRKSLVIDPKLSGSISRVAEFSFLKEHGVDRVFYLDAGTVETEARNVLYISRPTLENIQLIADQIKRASNATTRYVHHLLLVPRKTLIATKVLEDAGVLGDVVVSEFPLHFVALEEDLLSLELEGTFKELYLNGDISSLDYMARALMHIQKLYGPFPRILGKGDYGKTLVDILLRMRKEGSVSSCGDPADDCAGGKGGPGSSPVYPTNIDSLIVIDRAVDLITPMLTQMTYTGLLDEYIGVKTGSVQLDTSLFEATRHQDPPTEPSAGSSSSATPNSATPTTRHIPLSGSERIYRSLRDLNYAAVGSQLRQDAVSVQKEEASVRDAKSTTALRTFVGRLPELTSLKSALGQHTTMSEIINSKVLTVDFDTLVDAQQNLLAGIDVNRLNTHVELCIDRQLPIEESLRLLSLQSLIAGGIPQKIYDTLCHDIVQAYGAQHILTLQRMAKAGLLHPQTSGRNPFPQIRKHLKLIVDDFGQDAHHPSDMAFSYSGYAPISVRLIEVITRPVKVEGAITPPNRAPRGIAGWRGYDDVVRLVGGSTIDENQTGNVGVTQWGRKTARVSVLVFLGGITYSEISAIRWLASREAGHREFLIVTTQIINGDRMMREFFIPPTQI